MNYLQYVNLNEGAGLAYSNFPLADYSQTANLTVPAFVVVLAPVFSIKSNAYGMNYATPSGYNWTFSDGVNEFTVDVQDLDSTNGLCGSAPVDFATDNAILIKIS